MRRPRESPWVCTGRLWSDLRLGFMRVASVFGTHVFLTHSSAVNYCRHRLAHAPHPPVSSAPGLTLTSVLQPVSELRSARWPLRGILPARGVWATGAPIALRCQWPQLRRAGLLPGAERPSGPQMALRSPVPGFLMRTPDPVGVFSLEVTRSFRQQMRSFSPAWLPRAPRGLTGL